MRQFGSTATKGIRHEDICTGFGIGTMHTANDLGSVQIHLFRTTTREQSAFLQHGPHSTIKNQNLLTNRFKKIIHLLFLCIDRIDGSF